MLRSHSSTDLGDHLASTLSRRQALRRLSGLALVAAGGAALAPVAAAKPKRQDKRAKRRHRGGGAGATAPRRIPGDVTSGIGDPPVVEPGDPIVEFSSIPSALLEVTRGNDFYRVRVQATIDFSDADLQAMRAGKTCRLACELWENDDNRVTTVDLETDTFVFGFRGKNFSGGQVNPVESCTFEKRVAKGSFRELELPQDAPYEFIGLLTLTTADGRIITRATNLAKVF